MSQTQPYTIDDLEARAATFFDRPGFSMPAWLAHDRLAILDDRSGVTQLATLDLATGHATPMTGFAERLLAMVASDRGTLVFGMDTGGDERQQLWLIDSATGQPVRLTHQPEARFEPGAFSADGSLVLATSNARDIAMFDIVGIDVASGVQDMWLEASGTASALALNRDGSRALIKRLNTNLDASLLLIDRDTKTSRELNPHEGEAWIFDAGFSHDEASVMVLTNQDTEFVRLIEIDIRTLEQRVVVEAEWDVEAFALSPSGTLVATAINVQGWSEIEIRDTASGRIVARPQGLGRGTIDRFTWGPDESVVAFGYSSATDPSSIVLLGIDGTWDRLGGETGPDNPQVSEPELVEFPTFDGRSIPAFLFKPDGDGPFPVLVEIHGGPESQRRLQYSSAVPTDQFIQSLGIAVLSLNVRGSTGYGKSYSHLDDKDKRLDSVRDAIAAVEWLTSRADVIPDRIGV